MELCLSTDQEKSKLLPCDDVVSSPTITSTHGITIDAAIENVWPWIVQIGQDRGGFYSYSLLENLLGCRIKNAASVNPLWQNLNEGDAVELHPKFPPLLVKAIQPQRHLVLWQQTGFLWTWAFVLIPRGKQQCRLLVRTRISIDRFFATVLLYPIMTLGHYVMERKMLLGIRQRAERVESGV